MSYFSNGLLSRHLSSGTTSEDGLTDSYSVEDMEKKAILFTIALTFIVLILGQIFKHLSIATGFPYTPIITVFATIIGICMGLRMQNLKEWFPDGHSLCFPDGTSGEHRILRYADQDSMPASVLPEDSWQHKWQFDECTYIDYSFMQAKKIDPHLMLQIFLPALIFESAYNIDFHTFWRQKFQILLLAGPVLLGCVFVTASVMYWILGFKETGMTFMACAMFGAIVSATDPVAVVALLKELGVTKKISTLIEGESLLNDGTAMVVFIILLMFAEKEFETSENMMEMPLPEWYRIIGIFLYMSLGSYAFGHAFGYLMSLWLRQIHNNPVLEGNLTVCVPYLLFYICEQTGMSGIIGLVGCGVYMSQKGKTQAISSESEHSIHAVWSYIGFVAETVIFMLTGLILGEVCVSSEHFEWYWILQLLGLYVSLHIVRFGFLLLVMPIFKNTGYEFTIRHCALVSYGGLRGAVGLALALIVTHSGFLPRAIGEQTIFHISGIVFMTLTINGTTTGYVIKKLELKKESNATIKIIWDRLGQHAEVTQNIINEYMKEQTKVAHIQWDDIKAETDLTHSKAKYKFLDDEKMRKEAEECKQHKEKENMIHLSDDLVIVGDRTWKEIRQETQPQVNLNQGNEVIMQQWLSNINNYKTQQQYQDLNKDQQALYKALAAAQYAQKNLDELEPINYDPDWLPELRHIYLMEVKANYLHKFEDGLLMDKGLIILNGANDSALDKTDSELDDWRYVDEKFNLEIFIKLSKPVQGKPCIGKIVEQRLFSQIQRAYDVFSNYIDCHREAHDMLLKSPSGQNEILKSLITSEIEKQLIRAISILNGKLKANFPDIVKAVNQRRAKYYVLVHQIKHYHNLAHNGQIEEKHASMILGELDQQKAVLKRTKPSIKTFDSDKLVSESELNSIFDQETLDELLKRSNMAKQVFNPRDNVLKKGEKGKIYLVVRGILCEAADKSLAGYERKGKDESKNISLSNVVSEGQLDQSGIVGRQQDWRFSHLHEAHEIAGLQNLLEQFEQESPTTIFVEKSSMAFIIPLEVDFLREKLLENDKLLLKFWKNIIPKLVHSHDYRDDKYPDFFKTMHFKRLKKWFNDKEKARTIIVPYGWTIPMPAGGILWNGNLVEVDPNYQDLTNLQRLKTQLDRDKEILSVPAKLNKHQSANLFSKEVNQKTHKGIEKIIPDIEVSETKRKDYMNVSQSKAIVTVFEADLVNMWLPPADLEGMRIRMSMVGKHKFQRGTTVFHHARKRGSIRKESYDENLEVNATDPEIDDQLQQKAYFNKSDIYKQRELCKSSILGNPSFASARIAAKTMTPIDKAKSRELRTQGLNISNSQASVALESVVEENDEFDEFQCNAAKNAGQRRNTRIALHYEPSTPVVSLNSPKTQDANDIMATNAPTPNINGRSLSKQENSEVQLELDFNVAETPSQTAKQHMPPESEKEEEDIRRSRTPQQIELEKKFTGQINEED